MVSNAFGTAGVPHFAAIWYCNDRAKGPASGSRQPGEATAESAQCSYRAANPLNALSATLEALLASKSFRVVLALDRAPEAHWAHRVGGRN